MKRASMDRFIDTIEWIAAGFVGIVALDIFVSVLLRNTLNYSIPDSFDIGRMLLGILIFWGIAATSYRGTHITVDLIWANVGPRYQRLIDEFKLTRLRKTPALALSGGERRRCEIARALAGHPSFMLLDEPFAGIDPIAVGGIQDLVRHLKARGIGVLITDHSVRETLGLTDRAYIIYNGHVLTEGPPEEIVANPDVRRIYLGEDFKM